MNTVNTLTQVSPFVLKTGCSPRVLPPLVSMLSDEALEDQDEMTRAREVIERVNGEVEGAKDCLLVAKISQAHQANKERTNDAKFEVGEKVMLKTAHCRREYMHKKSGRVAKFMPCWDGPYEVLEAFLDSSTYRLVLPPLSSCYAMFHVSQLKTHVENDSILFLGRTM